LEKQREAERLEETKRKEAIIREKMQQVRNILLFQ